MIESTDNNDCIFIIDDCLLSIRILKEVLLDLNYSVRVAVRGSSAVKSIQNDPPDLILLDVLMPDMDGYEVCKRLKNNRITKDIPVIFISALSEIEAKVKALSSGGNDYITKPFQMEEVSARIQTHLSIRKLQQRLESKNFELSQEITERKQAEVQISKLSQALNESPNNFIITDIKGNIEFVNPSFTKLTGYSSEEIIGQHTRILQSGKTTTEKYKRMWQTITTGGTWKDEICNKKKNGELYWESATISTMKNHDGVVTNFIKVSEDITGRKRTEEELYKKNSYLKLLQVTAVAANEAEDINEAFLPILEQICYCTGWEIGHAYLISENDPDMLASTNVWYLEEQNKFMDFCTVTKETNFTRGIGLPGMVLVDRKPHWILDVTKDKNFIRNKVAKSLDIKSGIAFPVMVGSHVVAILEFFSTREVQPDQQFMEIVIDVGTQLGRVVERKHMEEVLLRAEKMKAMGIMVTGVAHEFNNILAVISGNAQLLEEANRSNKELSGTLNTICRMADDGAEIVDRMYDFTNICKDTSIYKIFDMNDLITQVIGFTKPRWKEMAHISGISYQIDWKEGKALPLILGNPSELREVVLNIINNALDAMPDGGTITIRTRCVRRPAEIREEKDSKTKVSCLEISFTDTGKGMTDDVKKRIFDPYFTTRSPEGTGLGMSVSYSIIKRHDGTIDVESEPGKGSTLILSLPIYRKSSSLNTKTNRS